jgi:hypothetical protein
VHVGLTAGKHKFLPFSKIKTNKMYVTLQRILQQTESNKIRFGSDRILLNISMVVTPRGHLEVNI